MIVIYNKTQIWEDDISQVDLFEEIFSKNYKAIYSFIYRFVGNQDDCSDLTQETFEKLYKSKFHKIDNPTAWLYRVGANLSNNHVKRSQNKKRRLYQLHDSGYSSVNTEDEYIRGEDILRIRRALARLKEKERTLLILYQDGLSHAEIARIINIKKGSVGKLLSRSFDKLSYILIDEGYSNE